MGKLIVIEGSCDGVGKSTQYKLLIDRLINEKEYDITSHHFPSYGTYQGRPVEEYLKGNFGNHSELSPYFVNSLYAQDRAITWVTGLKSEYDKGKLIVLDRYTTSNLAHQGSKILDKEERFNMYQWIDKLEFWLLELPKPDVTIFLHMPYEYAKELKKNRTSLDEHEKSEAHLRHAEACYLELKELYNWKYINCIRDNKIRTIEDINNEVLKLVLEEKREFN